MKAEMKSSLMRRYAYVEENEKLAIATILDPRFKDKFFTNLSVKNSIKALVREKTLDHTSDLSAQIEIDLTELPSKRPCLNVLKTFSEILEEEGTSFTSDISSQEFDTYLGEFH